MFKGRQFDRSVILLCVRWYLAYSLSLRNPEEMMAERGIVVDHATVGRWVVRYSPELLERFNRHKRPVRRKWHIDETYIKVRGRWMYLYRAIDSHGDTVEFWFSERRGIVRLTARDGAAAPEPQIRRQERRPKLRPRPGRRELGTCDDWRRWCWQDGGRDLPSGRELKGSAGPARLT